MLRWGIFLLAFPVSFGFYLLRRARPVLYV
jgi:hypothetical protein